MREISVQEMRDYMIGSAIFAQGQPENFYKSLTLIEDIDKKGLKPKLIDPEDVPDDALLCQIWQRSGGGYNYVNGEIDEYLGEFKIAYENRDFQRYYGQSLGKVVPELSKGISGDLYGYLTYCTSSSQGLIPMYISALEGKPFIDADCCGTAMWPHLDEVAGIKFTPIQVLVTPYGETVVLKDLTPKRAKFILEDLHRISGGWFIAVATGLAPFKKYKEAIVKNQASRMIKVGEAVRTARGQGRDPVETFLEVSPAYKLFEGEVELFRLEKTEGLVHGYWIIKGAGKFFGHTMRVFYSMENRISWLDDQPYVTIPDINAIVNSKTCESLSVLDHDGIRITDGIYNTRKVSVLGM